MTASSDNPDRAPHDALFRAVFGEPRRAAALLRTALPPRHRESHRLADAAAGHDQLRRPATAHPPGGPGLQGELDGQEDDATCERVANSDKAGLERLTRAVLTAASLAELFGSATD